MTHRKADELGQCIPVRPKYIQMLTTGPGRASKGVEPSMEQDQEGARGSDKKAEEQALTDLDMNSEEERSLLGPGSSEEGGPAPAEGQEARRVSRPVQPTKEEVLQHELTHLPFRSWCAHCVRGKGRNPPHKRITKMRKEEREVPTVSMD